MREIGPETQRRWRSLSGTSFRDFFVFFEDVQSWTYLNTLDQQLRQIFKGILHLPSSISTGFMYARKSDGGLGLPRLAPLVFHAHLRAGAVLAGNRDPLVQEVAATDYFQNTMYDIGAKISCPLPLSVSDINKHKIILKARECDDWVRCFPGQRS
jgi:hypothetical protein